MPPLAVLTSTASAPTRSHAISSLFLPPQASRSWIDLPAEKRRLAGVRLMTSATLEEEAQAIALLVREALDVPERRIAIVTADRGLARRVSQHLMRWNIVADDTAGRALSLTAAGRLLGLAADVVTHGPAPAALVGLLSHPLVKREDGEARGASDVSRIIPWQPKLQLRNGLSLARRLVADSPASRPA